MKRSEHKISPERKQELQKELDELVRFNKYLEETGQIYGTPTSISLKTLNEYNFKPIGITWMMCEETFIFETAKEAKEAFNKMEIELGKVVGWYYSKKTFEKEDTINYEVYWL